MAARMMAAISRRVQVCSLWNRPLVLVKWALSDRPSVRHCRFMASTKASSLPEAATASAEVASAADRRPAP